jgi:hypothetical protein
MQEQLLLALYKQSALGLVLLVASQAAARQSHHPDIKTCCYKLRHPTRYIPPHMPVSTALLYTFCLQEQLLLALYEE